MVYADLGKIQQVLYNLIDNAIKFSHQDSTIYIQTRIKNEKIFVSVKDTGIGIPKDSVKKVFDRCYKSDLSRGKDKKGTGLGLAIVKEIIQAHGENIDVVSTEGVGSEFIFFPAAGNKSVTEKEKNRMRKTGKWIAGVLLAMGMILAGTVSGFAATDLNVENVRWDGDSGSGIWTDNTSARYYQVKLYRNESSVMSTASVYDNSYDFASHMTRRGNYYFMVRAVGSGSEKGRVGKL